jgi:hypothetical protein
MNISDFKFYSLLFVALLVVGYIYLEQVDNRENAYSETVNDEAHRLAAETEQEANDFDVEDTEMNEEVLGNTVAARGILQAVGFKE